MCLGRARSNGVVEVYRNSVLLFTASVGTWPFAGSGGRIGLPAPAILMVGVAV